MTFFVKVLQVYALAASRAAVASSVSDATELELHYNVSNMGEQLSDPGSVQEWRWVVLLSTTTADLTECGTACLDFRGNSSGPFQLCQSFTRYVAAVGKGAPGDCYGHLDLAS